ncbi:hypothetical protein EDB81DRAFT_751012 [Dactylonectria macrodidyma]|uniref:Uncharacterized protein n=1 Tax=Dactylonectria macrodidyma TaxID=307937 RepID=A0A9P9JMS8_9HYPO|nr:hypothetical protein EDB81DRAFT_751012 [Dactylonectria macrodidyma]
MRAFKLPSVGFLSIVLLLCLSSIVATHEFPLVPRGHRIARKDEGLGDHHHRPNNGDEQPTDYGYGPPPPYYTDQPTSTKSDYGEFNIFQIHLSWDSTSTNSRSETGTELSTMMDPTSGTGNPSKTTDSSPESSGTLVTSRGEAEGTSQTAFSSAGGAHATRSATETSADSTQSGSTTISEETPSGSGTLSESSSSHGTSSHTSTTGYSFSGTASSSILEPTSGLSTSSSASQLSASGLSSTSVTVSSSALSSTPSSISVSSEATEGTDQSSTLTTLNQTSSSEFISSTKSAESTMPGSTETDTASESTSAISAASGLTTGSASKVASIATSSLTSEILSEQSQSFSLSATLSGNGTEFSSGLVSPTGQIGSSTTFASITTTTMSLNVTITISRSRIIETRTISTFSSISAESASATDLIPSNSLTWSLISASDAGNSATASGSEMPTASSTPSSISLATRSSETISTISQTSIITISAINSTSSRPTTSLFSSASSGTSASLESKSGLITSAPPTQTLESTLTSSTILTNATSQAGAVSITVVTITNTEGSVITIYPGGFTPTDTMTLATNSSAAPFKTSSATQTNFNVLLPHKLNSFAQRSYNQSLAEHFFADYGVRTDSRSRKWKNIRDFECFKHRVERRTSHDLLFCHHHHQCEYDWPYVYKDIDGNVSLSQHHNVWRVQPPHVHCDFEV